MCLYMLYEAFLNESQGDIGGDGTPVDLVVVFSAFVHDKIMRTKKGHRFADILRFDTLSGGKVRIFLTLKIWVGVLLCSMRKLS